ncbi:hypothetical protein [Streptomyces triculaminicus]|uniref:hypothetical protein n=1 Tax=Streptomyces triculaminicus TaxID=2816232 RepID=UPI0037D12F5C
MDLHQFGELGRVCLVRGQAGDGVDNLRLDFSGLAVGPTALDLDGLDGVGEQQAGLDGADLETAHFTAAVAVGGVRLHELRQPSGQ